LYEAQDAVEAYNRGLEYLDYNEPDQAITAFSEAIRLNTKHVHAYFARGCAWAERGELDKAIDDYSETIRLDPSYAAAYFNRAAAYRAKGFRNRADADLARCEELRGHGA
jgi:tetratricopeptide (TPR) repeat protein